MRRFEALLGVRRIICHELVRGRVFFRFRFLRKKSVSRKHVENFHQPALEIGEAIFSCEENQGQSDVRNIYLIPTIFRGNLEVSRFMFSVAISAPGPTQQEDQTIPPALGRRLR